MLYTSYSAASVSTHPPPRRNELSTSPAPALPAGSAAIAGVNFLKLPLIVLPLRHLLLEQLLPAEPSGYRHVALTFGLMLAFGCGSVCSRIGGRPA